MRLVARCRSETPQVYTPLVEECATQLQAQVAGFSGLELGKPDKVYVSLHAASQPGKNSAHVSESLVASACA